MEGGSNGVSLTISSTGRNSRSRDGRPIVATALHNLKKKCEQLKPYASHKKTELPEDVFNIFLQVSELASEVGGTRQYTEYLRITRSVFSDQIPGEGDTVADFFIGCDSARPKSGSRIGCESQCAGNLPLDGYTAEDFCDTHVGIYSSGSLSVTYSPTDKTDTIRIFHKQRDFTLSRTEVSSLREKGINTVILTYNGGSVPVSSRVSLMSLSSNKSGTVGNRKCVVSRSQARDQSRKDRDNTSGISGGGWAIGAIIFIILLIIVIWLVVYGMRGDAVTNPNVCGSTIGYDGNYMSNAGMIGSGTPLVGY
jgi:hypothetical protein